MPPTGGGSSDQGPCQGTTGALPPPHLESLVKGTPFRGAWAGLGRNSLCHSDGGLYLRQMWGGVLGPGPSAGPSELTLQVAAPCWRLARTRLCLGCWVARRLSRLCCHRLPSGTCWLGQSFASPQTFMEVLGQGLGVGGVGQGGRGQDPRGLPS